MLFRSLISDYAPGTPPDGANFPPRNRIISGLAMAIVVTEAGEDSGALITAESAADLAISVAVVSAPYGATTAAGGLRWLQHGRELSLRLAEEAPRVLIAGADDLRAGLRDYGDHVSVDGDFDGDGRERGANSEPAGWRDERRELFVAASGRRTESIQLDNERRDVRFQHRDLEHVGAA